MARYVLDTPEVHEALNAYVPVMLDAGAAGEVSRTYGVRATPTYLVIDAEGEVVRSYEGPCAADTFIAFLDGRVSAPGEGS